MFIINSATLLAGAILLVVLVGAWVRLTNKRKNRRRFLPIDEQGRKVLGLKF